MNDPHPSAHLLVVDDDLLLRSVATKTLKHAGFRVSEASSGEDALLKFDEGTFDLVLLDVMMPGLNGFEVCQRIRAMPRGEELPILMLTGLDDTESIELAYRHGATDFITKPINWTLLSHRVRYALRASEAAETLRHNSESLARAQRIAGMGNWQILPDGRMECSAQLALLFGASTDSHVCDSDEAFLARVVESDRARVQAARERLCREGVAYQMEFQIVRFDGTVRTVFEQAAPVQNDNSRLGGYEGITQDITERVEAQEKIRLLANYDAVTGLPNRQFFAELASAPLERTRRQGSMCAVFHIDIDRFKSVNDAFGREQGDAVLQTITQRLLSCSRKSELATANRTLDELDVLARVGSHAFTFLFADLENQEDIVMLAERLLKVIAQPLEMDAQTLVLSASIGIALFPGDATDLANLERCAEQAAYAAKETGGAQHSFFDEEMNVQAMSRLLLESDLRRAIGEGELRLYFQPKVDASNGIIVGAEALVRWQHPERGLLPPVEFIALAEESGLILPLTDWVLESACRSLREWSDAGLPIVPVSVNLAAPSLMDMTLIDKLDVLMQRFGLSPANLMLEMTETMLMRDVEPGIALLQTLRDNGYGLSLDDFGTGYSSLSYLRRFPVHELKIDRSFVIDSAQGGRDAVLAAAIIALGREFGLKVIAEGVETPAQSTFLLCHNCPTQQGFLFSRPVPDTEFVRMLESGLAVKA